MPERVRADAGRRARPQDVPTHETVDAARREPVAAIVEEQRVVHGPRGPRARRRLQRPPVLEVAAHGGGRGPVERQDALLAALAADAKHPVRQVDVLEVQADELAQAQARRVEQLQDGAVAPAERRRVVRRCEQLPHLDDVEMGGHPAVDAGRRDRRPGVPIELPVPAQIAAERPYGGQPPGGGDPRVAAPVQLAQKRPDAAVVEVGRPHAARAHPLTEKRQQLREVAPVRRHGVGRGVAVVPQILEERPEMLFHHASAAAAARQPARSQSARSASFRRRSRRLRGGRSGGGIRPNVMFVG